MSKLSYRLGLTVLLVLPACADPAPSGTDSDTDTSSGTSSTTDPLTTTDLTTTTVPTTSTTDEPTSTTTSTTIEPTTSSTSTSTTEPETTTSTSTTEDTDTSTGTTDADTDTGTGTTMSPDECADGELNGMETDIDCGGPACAPCADGGACLETTDCIDPSKCVDNVCTPLPPACFDLVQGEMETDVDCGGPDCQPCADTQACNVGDDCLSKVCTDNLCAAAACDDAIQNGEESDVDCGGLTCDACLDGDSCNSENDCQSMICVENICTMAGCDDNMLNGTETDVDCGGECTPCTDGGACLIDGDCVSGQCLENICGGAVSCEDGVQNGMETGIDCGGPDCLPCAILGLVINEVDYDLVGTDEFAEYVELLNTGDMPIDLAGHSLVLVNGSVNPAAPYTTVDLSSAGTINPGQYLVVAPAGFVAPPEALLVNFAGTKDLVQNGAPDGIALLANGALVDALSYEGSVTNANLPGLGLVSLVEGTVLPGGVVDSNTILGSLSRLPDGTDTNNAATDWAFSGTLTPGLANVP